MTESTRVPADAAAIERADDRWLEQALDEVCGGPRPHDLAAAVRAAVVAPRRRRRGPWSARVLAAACVLLGLVAVVGVTLDSIVHDGSTPTTTTPQEPKPVVVRNLAQLSDLPRDTLALKLVAEDGALLELLPELPALQRLDLSDLEPAGFEVVTATGLVRVAERVPALRELDLGGHWRDLDGAWLAPLAALPRLERLSLAYAQVAGVAADTLAAMPSLRHLDLSLDQTLTPAALATIVRGLPGLRSLSLRGCAGLAVADAGRGAAALSPVAELRQLEELDLGYLLRADLDPRGRVTKGSLAPITMTIRMVQAALADGVGTEAVVDPRVLAAVADLPKLRTLNLDGALALSPGDLRSIARLTQLRDLSLAHANIDDAVLRALPVSLRRIALSFTAIDDRQLAELAQRLVELRALDVDDCAKVGDDGVRAALLARELEELRIGGRTRVTAAIVPELLRREFLRVVAMCGDIVDRDAAERLRRLPRLRALILRARDWTRR